MVSPRMAPLGRIVQVFSIPTRGEDGRHGDVQALQDFKNIPLRAPHRRGRKAASRGPGRSSCQRPSSEEPEASCSPRQYGKHHTLRWKGSSPERRGSQISVANGHHPCSQL